MSKTDFQNGFVMGLASNGVVKAEPFDYLQYANTYANLFNGSAFPEGTEISFGVLNATDFSSMVKSATGLTKATIKGNKNENALWLNGICNSNKEIVVVDFSKCKLKVENGALAFYGTSALTQILGEFDFSVATNVTNMFVQATSLEEVRFKENTLSLSISFAQSSKLSADSIESIIKGLATVGTQQTLTLNASVAAALTAEQMIEATNKNWVVQ
jgi:hypothetical protein